MFFTLSKTFAKFGGWRLGARMRMNKKNASWLFLLIALVELFKLMWYIIVFSFWLIYAMCYGIYWCIKKTINASTKKANEN